MQNFIDINQIKDMLPHRYPILLVDRIVDYVEGDHITGLKNVTFNEPHFMGHFPSTPIMPGVLIVEAMAQTAAIYVVKVSGDKMAGKLVYFMSIEEAKFRHPVVPGDSLYICAKVARNRGNVWKFSAEAMVGDKIVAEATFTAMVSA